MAIEHAANQFSNDDEKQKIPTKATPGSLIESSEDAKETGIDQIPPLARQLTNKSIAYSNQSNLPNPFLEGQRDSAIDPASEKFSPKEWLKLILSIQSRDPERYPARTAGVSFNDLSVHGFGTPTDYQKDVGNVVLELGSVARWIMGTGKQKIQILRGFDGLVRSGDMLMVLGRPGSGCSTLLESIAGETNGIYISNESRLNYQGLSRSLSSFVC